MPLKIDALGCCKISVTTFLATYDDGEDRTMNFDGRKFFRFLTVTVSRRFPAFIHSALTVLEGETS
jgi:hypothetical protein